MLYNKMEQSVLVQQFMRYDAAKASRPSQSGSNDHQASTSRPSIRRSPLNRGGMRLHSPSAGW